jgi:type VI secretion system secreted protein Hcp
MKIEGPNLDGPSTTAQHVTEFELEVFSFGVSNTGTFHVGGGSGGAGKPNLLPFTIRLMQSKNLATIYEKIHDGSNFTKVTITATNFFDAGLEDYLIFMLQDEVAFTSMKSAATNNDSFIIIPLTVFSDKLEVKHYKADNDGSRNDTPLETKWDIVGNVAY